jgi:hypothetical protein
MYCWKKVILNILVYLVVCLTDPPNTTIANTVNKSVTDLTKNTEYNESI